MTRQGQYLTIAFVFILVGIVSYTIFSTKKSIDSVSPIDVSTSNAIEQIENEISILKKHHSSCSQQLASIHEEFEKSKRLLESVQTQIHERSNNDGFEEKSKRNKLSNPNQCKSDTLVSSTIGNESTMDMSTLGSFPDFVFPFAAESSPSIPLQHATSSSSSSSSSEAIDDDDSCLRSSPLLSRPRAVHPVTRVPYTQRCGSMLKQTGKTYLPIFYQYSCYHGILPSGMSLVHAIGVMSPMYMTNWGSKPKPDSADYTISSVSRYLDQAGEEYFQDAAVLEAVYHATGKLTVIELGAGTGRWLMYAYHANIQLRNLPIFLIGVEADWMHFHHLRSNLFVNGVREYEMQLWRAAVGTKMGTARFTVGNSHGWYGQFLTSGDAKSGAPGAEKVSVVDVEVVDLVNLIEPHYRIDYLDFDIQYQERPVIEQAIDLIDERVRYMWVEIHEKNDCLPLRELMRTRGWIERYAACCKGEEKETPYGVSYRCEISAIFVKNPKIL